MEALEYGPAYKYDLPLLVKVAYFDIDNTLVPNDSPDLPSGEFCRLAQAAGNSITIALATARSLQRTIHIIDAIDPKGISVLSNGAVMYDAVKKEIIADYSIPLDIATAVIGWLHKNHMSYEIQDDGVDFRWTFETSKLKQLDMIGVYNTSENPLYPSGQRIMRSDYTLTKPRIIAVELHDQQSLKSVTDYILGLSGDGITSLLGHTTYHVDGSITYEVFIVNIHANKKDALRRALQLQGIDKSNAMAVIDGYNDLSVFESTAINVAVSNAVQPVLDKAVFIAPSMAQNGAAIALKALVIDLT